MSIQNISDEDLMRRLLNYNIYEDQEAYIEGAKRYIYLDKVLNTGREVTCEHHAKGALSGKPRCTHDASTNEGYCIKTQCPLPD